jgi:hypothetical protein
MIGRTQVRRPDGRRAARYKRISRRRRLAQQTIASLGSETLSPEECFALIFGSARQARCAANRASRRLAIFGSDATVFRNLAQSRGQAGCRERPIRQLSRLNRSSVFPPLLSEQVAVDARSVSDILAVLRRDYAGLPPHQLMDAFATASGFGFEVSAEILFAYGVISHTIDPNDVAVTRDARTFWDHYNAGRVRYSTLAANASLRGPEGDWAYFESRDLDLLLPGVLIPTRLRRHHYFTNWISADSAFSLDVYAGSTGESLFQHPFPYEFNPLVFGTGRSHSHSKQATVGEIENHATPSFSSASSR